MPLDIIVGAQWGDEGKGRIVDLLSAQADYVARFNGGDNAGHTVTVGDQTFKLHLIPSGVIHPHTVALMGNGMVINPATLLEEMTMLRAAGVEISPERLGISPAAHLITPAHRALDQAREMARGTGRIGTTGRGIGPAYTDKVTRQGIRAAEMLDRAAFRRLMENHIEAANHVLATLYQAEPVGVAEVVNTYINYAEQLAPYIRDCAGELAAALESREKVLAEGAQGTLLDLDHGTYPYVTSSNPTAAGALVGLGIGPRYINRVIGVTKVFQTRVGEGPFPTEQTGELAARLRGTGANPWDEFGTTTGRPRRVGWLDLVLLRYAAQVNGLTELALSKLDILTGIDPLQICVAYRTAEGEIKRLPFGPRDLDRYEPVYESLPGWTEDVRGAREWFDLPLEARTFIRRIGRLSGVSVGIVSVGPERDQVVEALA